MIDTTKVTRVELIDDKGRAYIAMESAAFVDLQDDGRTLKIFVSRPKGTRWVRGEHG